MEFMVEKTIFFGSSVLGDEKKLEIDLESARARFKIAGAWRLLG